MAEELLKLDVIYGDTDSIMINTGSTTLTDVKEKGARVKAAVNKLYRHLEIDIDGIFKSMLLLKKKKYAAMKLVERGDEESFKRETKGLDMVRRDWCILSKEIGSYVLDRILSGQSRDDVVADIHACLRQVAQDIKEGKVQLRKFIITKGLTKAPEEYPDAHAQPHVKVALRLKSMGRTISAGEHVPYVICQVANTPAIADRAFHPDEIIKSNGALLIDTEWYISQQIFPPVQRLCEPIEGTDSAKLAECLGMFGQLCACQM